MAPSSKRDRSTSDANIPTKKIKSAKDVSNETVIAVGIPEQKTSDGNDQYWDLSVKRRVTVQEYKGTILVGLREFYEKDGKSLPGKSGISLTPEQFAVLLKAAPAIKVALSKKGINIRDEVDEADDAHREESTGVEEPGSGKSEESVKADMNDEEDE